MGKKTFENIKNTINAKSKLNMAIFIGSLCLVVLLSVFFIVKEMDKPLDAKTYDEQTSSSSQVSSKDTSSEDTSSEDVSSEDTSSEDVSSEDTSSEETSSEDVSSEDTSSEDTSSEETSSEDVSSEDTSSEDTSSKDTSSEDTSSEDTSSEIVPVVPKWTEQPVNQTMYVKEKCSIRNEAIVGATVVASLKRADAINVIAHTNTEYYKIADGQYVHEDFLVDTPFPKWIETAVNQKMYVTESCNVRNEAVVGATVVSSLKRMDEVNVIAHTDTEYYKIADGQFIHEDFLSTTKPAEPSVDVNTSQNGNVSDGSISSILNNAPLNPRTTGVPVLDNKVTEIFSRIMSSSDSTYTKVKACYDYLINNTTYERGVYYPTAGFGDISHEGSSNYVNWSAMSLFNANKGSCNRYSSAFIVMMNRIGLDAGYTTGDTTSSGGGYTGHVWVEVYINGQTYVFDPQVEDNIAKGGTIQYLRFCKTYGQVPGKYIPD